MAMAFCDLIHLYELSYTRVDPQQSPMMTFANIHDIIQEDGKPSTLLLELACPPRKTKQEGGGHPWEPISLFPDGRPGTFWLMERVVDKNLPKILHALNQFDSREFLGLIRDPYRWGGMRSHNGLSLGGIQQETLRLRVEKMERWLGQYCLGRINPLLQPLHGQQRRALDRLLSSRLTLVWGPPGKRMME